MTIYFEKAIKLKKKSWVKFYLGFNGNNILNNLKFTPKIT